MFRPALLPCLADLAQYRTVTSGRAFSSSSSCSSSSSSSSSESTPVHSLAESSEGGSSALLVTTLEKAAACVHRHALLKSAQQLRDDELTTVLDPYLPTALTGMIRSYAAEVALLPLQFDNHKCTTKTSVNEPIVESIRAILTSGEPDMEQFQMQILRNHGNQLDIIFAPAMFSMDLLDTIEKARNEQQAWQKLCTDFDAMTNYRSYCESESVLEPTLLMLKNLPVGRQVLAGTLALDVYLLIDAMRKKVKPALDQCHRREALQAARAELLLGQARLAVKSNTPSRAYGYLLDALEIYCQLREKSCVVHIVVELIQQGGMEHRGHHRELLKFYELARKLCLAYPADFRAYANLVFAMDAVYREHADFSATRNLYRLALDDGMRLPFSYHAKFLLMHVEAEKHAGQSTPALVKQIKSAVTEMGKDYQERSGRPLIRRSATDLNPSHFFLGFIDLFQMLATLAEEQFRHFKEMDAQQQDDCAAMFELNLTYEQLTNYHRARLPALRPSRRVVTTPNHRMVHAIAGFYRNALHIMSPEWDRDMHGETAEKTYVSVFTNLVNFYLGIGAVKALAALLADENVSGYVRYASFKSALPAWRESLVMLKETMKKTKASAVGE